MDTQTRYEVVISAASWRPAVMPLFTDRQRYVTAGLVRQGDRDPTTVLAGTFAAAEPPRTGADYPPLTDWLAVAAPAGEPPDSPAEWIARLRPRTGQTLVILLIGFGADRSGWRGWVVEGGGSHPLSGFRIIGSGMVETPRTVHPGFAEEAARWSRVRGAVGERAFEKVRHAAVGVVGCSRSGTLAATMLAALGVRDLVLLDGDSIEPPNLDGLFLATPDDMGANKAVTLGRRLTAYRPDLLVRACVHPLDSSRPDPFGGRLDLIVTGVDQGAPRLRVGHWAREHQTPHLDIGTGVTRTATGGRDMAADVRLLMPGEGCVRCVGGLGDLEQAEYELYAPPRSLPRRPPEPWDASGRLGSLITLNALAVSTGIQSWLDLLDGSLAGSIWHRLRWVPGVGPEVNSARVEAGAGCRLCRLAASVQVTGG